MREKLIIRTIENNIRGIKIKDDSKLTEEVLLVGLLNWLLSLMIIFEFYSFISMILIFLHDIIFKIRKL
jgi:hypothetical protein